MVSTLRPLTYEDLLHMPDDGQRYEVIGGELIVNPAPRREHQEVMANLDWILQRYVRESGAGRAFPNPVDVYLGRNDIVQPDLVVIQASRLGIYQPEGVVVEPPDIVVEIVSPSTRAIDCVRKFVLYARSGVPEYWIANPAQKTLVINALTGNEYIPIEPDADGRLASHALAGLRVDPREVFAGLD